MSADDHTPPLGFALLTPLYDRAVELFTREHMWRTRLVERLDPREGEAILDVGSGTGTLAVAVTSAAPGCIYRGIDPDVKAVERARSKVRTSSSAVAFEVGFLPDAPQLPSERVGKLVCSLVLHQVPMAEKQRMLAAMLAWLKPGGTLFIADYGLQRSALMRLAFRATVQLLDGVENTQSNADGRLPELIAVAGFEEVEMLDRFATPSGSIEIIRASRKSA